MKQTRTKAATGWPGTRRPDDAELTLAERATTLHGMLTAVVMGHLISLIVYSPYWYR